MTDYYVNTAGSNTSPYDTWAKAATTWQAALTLMAAGDRVFIQGATTDTAVSARTITTNGTVAQPIFIIGCKAATTNQPPTTSDLAVRGTDTLALFTNTSTGAIDFGSDLYARIHGVEINAVGDLIFSSSSDHNLGIVTDCIFVPGSNADIQMTTATSSSRMEWTNCEFDLSAGTGNEIKIAPKFDTDFSFVLNNCVFTLNASANRIFDSSFGVVLIGCDLSGIPTSCNITNNNSVMKLIGCSLPSTFAGLSNNAPSAPAAKVVLIGCDSGSSKANSASYLNYQEEGYFGNIDTDTTAVRTGGATDGATGEYSWAMVPNVDVTWEGTNYGLTSPWMSVWIPGGASKTLTIYFANDSGLDFNTDDVLIEMWTPDDSVGDTAQLIHNISDANYGLLTAATVHTDDAASTWNGTAANGQKYSVTYTPGYEGLVYARVLFCKSYAATPDTLWVDPEIEVT